MIKIPQNNKANIIKFTYKINLNKFSKYKYNIKKRKKLENCTYLLKLGI